MDRVIFLVEDTQERLGCLLNPESLELRRIAGVEPRRTLTGALAGAALSDSPLIATGGGLTEIRLDLLFDVSIAGSSLASSDVRDLTRPFWRLAENASDRAGLRAQVVHFIWGTGCDIPCVVAAVAERLEQFDADSAPSRSWLRMRLLRVGDQIAPPAEAPDAAADLSTLADDDTLAPDSADASDTHQTIGGGVDDDGDEDGERLDDLAWRRLGGAWMCRAIAAFNDLDDLLCAPPRSQLRIPSGDAVRRHRARVAGSTPEQLAES